MTPVTHTGNKFVKMEEPSQGLNMSIHPLLAGCGIDHKPLLPYQIRRDSSQSKKFCYNDDVHSVCFNLLVVLGAVVNVVPSQQQGPGFDSWAGRFCVEFHVLPAQLVTLLPTGGCSCGCGWLFVAICLRPNGGETTLLRAELDSLWAGTGHCDVTRTRQFQFYTVGKSGDTSLFTPMAITNNMG